MSCVSIKTVIGNCFCIYHFWKNQQSSLKRPITTKAITKRNTVNKKNLTNKKVFLTFDKGLLPYKQDLLTYIKQDLLANTKKPRQAATANFHGKFLWQIFAANSRGKFFFLFLI